MEKFALKSLEFSSLYLNREDREQMILDLYMSEKNTDSEISKSVLIEIQDKLAFLTVTDQSKFPWRNFVEEFGNRHKFEDFVEVVARDLLLIEHTNKIYRQLMGNQLKGDEEFKSNLDSTALELAKILQEKEIAKGHV